MSAILEPTAPARTCDCPACDAGFEPFTVDHFRVWAADLVLDDGKRWVVEPFQEAFLADVFSGIPVCWLVIPEGNGKTTLVAGMGLYWLEHYPFAAIPVAASSKEQADTLYGQAEGFVMRTPRMISPCEDEVLAAKGLAQVNSWQRKEIPRYTCQEGFRRIKFYAGGRIQIRAADDRTGDGIIPAGILIIDELHRHRDLKLYRTWVGKIDKRPAQVIVISTAGEPGGEFEEEREDIRQSSDVIEKSETFTRAASEERVLHDWSVPEDGDVQDFELVARANPFSSVTAASLARKFQRLGKAGKSLQHWRRLTCNLPTRSNTAAIQESEWFAASTGESIPLGEPVWVGLDVAWKWDTTAMVPLWVRDSGFRLLGPASILTPPRDGTSLDPNLVERALIEIHARNPIHTVVMDTSRAEQLAEWISQEFGALVIDRPQSNAEAVQDFERFMEALRMGWLKHSGDVGMTRHALNAVARILPQGDARFDRPSQTRQGGEQDRRVIDALTAAAMVHSFAGAPVGVGGIE